MSIATAGAPADEILWESGERGPNDLDGCREQAGELGVRKRQHLTLVAEVISEVDAAAVGSKDRRTLAPGSGADGRGDPRLTGGSHVRHDSGCH